ncbi:MAG: cellulase family glycosylhydrolase [Bacteriovoracaceae bacterium]|nr:cellulase family glycosylhydrolase [Bacteriovoracaceae bacterium]
MNKTCIRQIICSLLLFSSYTLVYGKITVAKREFSEGHKYVNEKAEEVLLRGYNISISSMHIEKGFLPYKNVDDANQSLTQMSKRAGSNIVRLLVQWEAIHPEPHRIDWNYLEKMSNQMKVAIKNGMYVIIDFHNILYSRFFFRKKNRFTGAYAPKWIIPQKLIGKARCIPFCIHWGQHNITDPVIKTGFSSFWENWEMPTELGLVKPQDAFTMQMEITLKYLKKKLTPSEFSKILGIDPMNEPIPGRLGKLSQSEYEKKYVWPFYKSLRKSLDGLGLREMILWGEPLVFWNTDLPIVGLKPRAIELDTELKTPNFVLNVHSYDAKRMGKIKRSKVTARTYLEEYQTIRKEAVNNDVATIVSEYGMFVDGKGPTDPHKVIRASQIAMNISDINEDGEVALIDPPLSSIQWHWGHYYDHHQEPANGNTKKILKSHDAWNAENFSVVGEYSTKNNIDDHLVERIWSPRCSGEFISQFFQSPVKDKKGKALWPFQLKLGSDRYEAPEEFFWVSFRDTQESKESSFLRIFIPPRIDLTNWVALVDGEVVEGLKRDSDGQLNLKTKYNLDKLHSVVLMKNDGSSPGMVKINAQIIDRQVQMGNNPVQLRR